MKRLAILILVMTVTFGYAQAPDTLWTKTYGGVNGDAGYAIQQTLDGGYIISGSTASFGAGEQDVWLLKTDANGDTIWTNTYGGTEDDWAEDVQQTMDGGYVIGGVTGSFSAGGRDIWILKTNSTGDTLWTKTYDWITGVDYIGSVLQIPDGYLIAGGTWFLGMHPLLLKIDLSGDSVWMCNFSMQFGQVNIVRGTYDGMYLGAGTAGNSGLTHPWLFKFDTNGNVIWSMTYPVVGHFTCFAHAGDNGYIGYGWCRPYPGYDHYEMYILRTDIDGDTLWTRQYGDSLYQWLGNSIQLTYDGNYICTGACGEELYYQPDDFYLLKMDGNGDSLWCLIYGESGYSEEGKQVLQSSDGGYVAIGYTESYGAGGADLWLVKTEPDVGVEEHITSIATDNSITSIIFIGPLQLSGGRQCKVFDITGRMVQPESMKPGIYFVEIDGVVIQKVVKVR